MPHTQHPIELLRFSTCGSVDDGKSTLIGRLLYESITKRDYPVMTGILLMISISVVLANLLTDIVHALIDPRVGRS